MTLALRPPVRSSLVGANVNANYTLGWDSSIVLLSYRKGLP